MASKKCPSCGLFNSESSLVCECGHDFAAADIGSSTSKPRACPFCGAEVHGDLDFCRNCGREFGKKKKLNLKMPELTWRVDPYFWSGAFGTLVILGLLGAVFYIAVDTMYLWPFLGGATLILAIMATMGRFDYPKWFQFLLTLLVSFIPLLGTAYALYFAGKYLARYRKLVVLTVFFALLAWGMIFAPPYLPKLAPLLASFQRAPESSPVAVSETATLVPSTLKPSPTVQATTGETIPTLTEIPTFTPRPSDCKLWSEVTPGDVGSTICVYGTVYAIVFDGNMYYISFGKFKVGDFYLAVYSRNYKPSFSEGDCIELFDEIKQVGDSPVIASNGYNLQVAACQNR